MDVSGGSSRPMLEDFVFISGRYGDYDGYLAIESRIGRAREHAAQLARAGIPYFSPHLNSAHFEVVVPDVPVEFWLRLDRAFLHRAAAVLVITFEAGLSAGTVNDVKEARERGIPVYYTEEIQALIDWWAVAHA